MIVVVFLLQACQNTDKIKHETGVQFGEIMYDTFLVNRDSTDTWSAECLAKFDKQKLIDKIFENVYSGKLTAYDYFSGERMLPEQIRKMEKEGVFTRKEISKIQFNERWIWDESANLMRKELISMTIGYEVYNNEGTSRGQKPIFKIIFKNK